LLLNDGAAISKCFVTGREIKKSNVGGGQIGEIDRIPQKNGPDTVKMIAYTIK
jgi:hypothetical protein